MSVDDSCKDSDGNFCETGEVAGARLSVSRSLRVKATLWRSCRKHLVEQVVRADSEPSRAEDTPSVLFIQLAHPPSQAIHPAFHPFQLSFISPSSSLSPSLCTPPTDSDTHQSDNTSFLLTLYISCSTLSQGEQPNALKKAQWIQWLLSGCNCVCVSVNTVGNVRGGFFRQAGM